MNENRNPKVYIYGVLGALGFIILIVLLAKLNGAMGYFNKQVGSEEVGVKFMQNQPKEVLGPGVYTEWSPANAFTFQFPRIETVSTKGLNFQVSDEEVLTKDKQRLGVLVTGTVFRPGLKDPQTLLSNWGTYKQFYTNDDLLLGHTEQNGKDSKFVPGLMQNLGDQAAKVCIGDSNFDDAVIGSARDTLRDCIETELTKLVSGYGLTVQNIVVPNIILSKPVQDQLDAITQSRLATQVAQQTELQNTAEAKATAAKQAGEILVEQGKIQEKARQDKTTADLQVQALEAQHNQIEAQKNNDLYSAQRDKDIADAQRLAAQLKAQADLAPEIAKAQMLQQNPAYVDLQKTQAMAAAYKNTDKVVTVPDGTNPITFLGNSGSGQPSVIVSPNGSSPAPAGH